MQRVLRPASGPAFDTTSRETDTNARFRKTPRAGLLPSGTRPSWVAIAVTALLAAGCGGGDDNNTPNVAQLNALTGATDVTVEFHEGTNMAATPSPDGQRIAFTAQGALWVMPFAAARPRASRHGRSSRPIPCGRPTASVIAFQNYTRRRQLAHLDRATGRQRREGDHHRLLRRPRAGLDAGRQRARVLVGPQQRRPVQDLELHPLERRLQAADDRAPAPKATRSSRPTASRLPSSTGSPVEGLRRPDHRRRAEADRRRQHAGLERRRLAA